MTKIERWRLDLPKDNKDAWNGEVTVTLDRYDLNLLVGAISTSYYEGYLSEQDKNYLIDKLNINDN